MAITKQYQVVDEVAIDFSLTVPSSVVLCPRYDNRGRAIKVRLKSGGEDFNVPEGYFVHVYELKSDGHVVDNLCEHAANVAMIEVTRQMTAVLGKNLLRLALIKGEDGSLVQSCAIYLQVVESPDIAKVEGSLDEFGTFDEFVHECQTQAASAKQSATAAAESQAAATQSATVAQGSATKAQSSAGAAAHSAEKAQAATVHEPKIISGTWHTWDQQGGKYVDTGVAVTERGPKGDAGKTPVKGVDYFTPAERQELLDPSKVYSATFAVGGWVAADNEWTQTASCANMRAAYDVGAPWYYKTGNVSTDAVLQEAFSRLVSGVLQTVDGGIKAVVKAKPTSDVRIYVRRAMLQ